MKINWILRFKNKTVFLAAITALSALVYQVIALFGIVPAVSEEKVIEVAILLANLLVAAGIMIDPTTEGVSDSDRALAYEDPKSSK